MEFPEGFIREIEIQYLRILAEMLKMGKIDVPTARASAKQYLTYLPFSSPEDLMTKMNDYVMAFPMLGKYHLHVAHEVEDIKTKHVLAKMRHMMKNDNIDEAISLAKQ